MRAKKILNISLAVFLLLTFCVFIYAFVQIQTESEHLAGHELLGTAVATAFLGMLSVSVFVIEISLNFNLRYFLLCQNKTALKTVLNILMIAATAGIVGSVVLLYEPTMMRQAELLWLLCLIALILLRIVNCFVPDGKKTSAEI